jgi:hypothetical protein
MPLFRRKSFHSTAHELLRRREAGQSWPALMRLSGWQAHSVKTIVSRARTGKLKPPGGLRKGGWTPEEDSIMRMYWPSENSHQIAARLNRSHWAVNARARRLGLSKSGSKRDWRADQMTP